MKAKLMTYMAQPTKLSKERMHNIDMYILINGHITSQLSYGCR